MPGTLDKRSAVLGLLAPSGEPTYVPAAFFLHFDRAHHSGQAAVDKHIEFFRFTGMDFVKVQFEVDFPSVQIDRPQDWGKFPVLDSALLQPQFEVVCDLVKALKGEALVVLTLYSPMMIAAGMGGQDRLNQDLEENFVAVQPALERVTEGLLAFVRQCIDAGLDGFYHSTQGGESRRFSDPSVFETRVKPYDLALMTEINRACRFNILHICDYHRDQYGGYEDLSPFLDYPGHVVNCNPEGRSLRDVASFFGRPFMGGMARKGPLATGNAENARQAAREALSQAPSRFILGADCTVPGDTPWENLRAAIDVAHSWTSR